MKITGQQKKKRDEIVKELDFLADLQRVVNIKENAKIEVEFLPNDKNLFAVNETLHSNTSDEVKEVLAKENDAETTIGELMGLKEKGQRFTYTEALSILKLPSIQEFKEKYKETEKSIIKTRVIKAMCQKDLDEATKDIVDLIYKSDGDTELVIASVLDSFNAEASLRRSIISELNKDERLERDIILFWGEELFRNIDITDDKRVEVVNDKSSKDLNMRGMEFTEEYDDLDVQKEINILRDSGIEALMNYLKENNIDERSFNIGDLDEVVESLKEVKEIKYLDFVNKLERIAMGEIEDDTRNKEEFKSEYIDEKASKNDIYVVELGDQIEDKYYVTRDMAREILNLSSIQNFRGYQKLLSENVDKIRTRAMVEKVDVDEESEVLISLIRGNGPVKLESVLNELVMYTENMSDDVQADEIYNEANQRCGELFLSKRDSLKDLIRQMNKELLKDGEGRRINAEDIDDMFTADDSKIENKIINELKACYEENGNKYAKYALAEINYMEKIGDLLDKFEINLIIPEIKERVTDLAYEEDKDKQAIGIVELIMEARKGKKVEDTLLFELMDFGIDNKLQRKIDILLEKERDDKKITTQEYMKWAKNITKLRQYQRGQGMEI